MSIVYLSSPRNQAHAHMLQGLPVLVSYATWMPVLEHYMPTFPRVMIDSGAFSVLNSGKRVILSEYVKWARKFRRMADGIAALDDIAGDWQQGLENWVPHRDWMFPTYHDSDPPEALDEILSYRPTRIGLGMVPPRTSHEWLAQALARIPENVIIHGWALRRSGGRYQRIDSFDSTNWLLDARKILKVAPWLTPMEATEVVVKRYQREYRLLPGTQISVNMDLFRDAEGEDEG